MSVSELETVHVPDEMCTVMAAIGMKKSIAQAANHAQVKHISTKDRPRFLQYVYGATLDAIEAKKRQYHINCIS